MIKMAKEVNVYVQKVTAIWKNHSRNEKGILLDQFKWLNINISVLAWRVSTSARETGERCWKNAGKAW